MSIRSLLATCIATCATLAVITTGPLQAQSSGGLRRKLVQVVVSGGLTVPSGDLKTYHDNGFHYDGSLIFNIPGFPIALRPEVSLTTLKLKKNLIPAGTTSGYGSNSSDTKLLSGLGNIEVPLAAGLYVIGGLGAMNLQSKLSGTTTDESATKLVIDAGAGFRFHMSRIDGFVEARMGSASYDNKKFGYSKAQFIPVSFGLAF